MVNFISKLSKKISSNFFLDKNEIFYVKKFCKKNINKKYSKKIILYNSTADYYSLSFGYLLSKEEKYKELNFILFFPDLSFYNCSPYKNFFFFVLRFYYKNLLLFIVNLKWKKLYKSFGSKFISFNNYNIFRELKNIRKAQILKKKIKSSRELIDLRYKGIKVGDLVYDTYLRFKNVPTVDLNNFFLIEILAKLINCFDNLIILKNKDYDISEFFTNQIAYIQHGLISRFLRKSGTDVKYTGAKSAYITNFNEKNYFQAFNFRKFKTFFEKLKNKNKIILLSKKLLKKKFSGTIIPQENWMSHAVYGSNKTNINLKNIKVIIFLHCFIDCPTSRGKFLFLDFADWVNQVLNFFRDKNLQKYVAIKPHPHGKDGSKIYVEKLKKQYSDFKWVNEKTPNNSIFNSKPLMGLSVLGTVLPEIAYHGIPSISAGTHPSMSFNFVFTPKTLKDYFKLINLGLKKKLNLPKNYKSEIYKYYYCDYIYDDPNNDDLLSKRILLKEWNFSNSDILKKFISKLNDIKL
jgi:hypothetical protein